MILRKFKICAILGVFSQFYRSKNFVDWGVLPLLLFEFVGCLKRTHCTTRQYFNSWPSKITFNYLFFRCVGTCLFYFLFFYGIFLSLLFLYFVYDDGVVRQYCLLVIRFVCLYFRQCFSYHKLILLFCFFCTRFFCTFF